MITSSHVIVFAEDAETARKFLRDTLELPGVDAGGGWLIFRLPPAEVAVHPAGEEANGAHELFLMCDDLEATVAELTSRGVQLASPIEEAGFGRITRLRVPGAGTIGLYEPKHATAWDL
jgi:catechol 2,3-dioxygenase-like lactoylglutathione lyase family enzyme